MGAKTTKANCGKDDELNRKKEVYTKINLWSCVIGFIMAVAGMVINIIVQFSSVNIRDCLAIAIIVEVVGVIAIVMIVFSGIKLRIIEKKLKLSDVDDTKESQIADDIRQ